MERYINPIKEDERQLDEHINQSKYTFVLRGANAQIRYSMETWRAYDLDFHCPFNECCYHFNDSEEFNQHLCGPESPHQPDIEKGNFKAGVDELDDEGLRLMWGPYTAEYRSESPTESRPATLTEAPASAQPSTSTNSTFENEGGRYHFTIAFYKPKRAPKRPRLGPSEFSLYTWRGADHHFHCPFERCYFYGPDAQEFERHLNDPKIHNYYEIEEASFKNTVKRFNSLGTSIEYEYEPKGYRHSTNLSTSNTTSDSSGSSKAPNVAAAFTIPPHPATLASSSTSNVSAPLRSPAKASLRTSNTSAPDKGVTKAAVLAALQDECKKRIRTEMERVLAENNIDWKASASKVAEIRAWFEGLTRTLEAVDGAFL
ncbi:hypothetical protein BJ508DRAFT_313772 [Ascobolus immersus RN42]|uniref:Uncharacterized protein n=1 Tax=Ascobolus immersus RN42 TaxID=1160509 RepID=A0A3N4HHK9_ASCIM|nr:hypothetical protein BJ508DRAFT_313772 [Ascobolus immersus RN42]